METIRDCAEMEGWCFPSQQKMSSHTKQWASRVVDGLKRGFPLVQGEIIVLEIFYIHPWVLGLVILKRSCFILEKYSYICRSQLVIGKSLFVIEIGTMILGPH